MSLPDTQRCCRGLLVDDDPLYLRTLQRSLQKRGIESAMALNPA